jgi:hypothetical protein
MKTLHICLQGLLLLWLSNFLSGCLTNYPYQAKVIQIQLRSKDDPTKVWETIDGVLKALDYGLQIGTGPADLDIARTYVRSRFGDNGTIHVEFDKNSRVFRIKKLEPWLRSGLSTTDIDSRLQGLRTLLAQALPGTTVIIVNDREKGQANLFPLG